MVLIEDGGIESNPEPPSRIRDPRGLPGRATRSDFESLVAEVEPRLRRALVAAYGPEKGREATAEALAYAWEHRTRLAGIDNVAGYLYRVGQTKVRRRRPWKPVFDLPVTPDLSFEPKLMVALGHLSRRQRLAVVLVHGFDWTPSEVAEATGMARTTVNSHLVRGLKHLRRELGADDAR